MIAVFWFDCSGDEITNHLCLTIGNDKSTAFSSRTIARSHFSYHWWMRFFHGSIENERNLEILTKFNGYIISDQGKIGHLLISVWIFFSFALNSLRFCNAFNGSIVSTVHCFFLRLQLGNVFRVHWFVAIKYNNHRDTHNRSRFPDDCDQHFRRQTNVINSWFALCIGSIGKKAFTLWRIINCNAFWMV